ncbi:MAG TPA: glycosyltransferase [Pirellulales bacterium]|nr:glycosyltransferase [Pirellulales bacterium]
MSRISIIIPTLENTEALESTLLSVLERRPPRSEIVVVLGCVYTDPYGLKDEIRFVQAPDRSTLVDLVNCGIAAARSEVVHVLACGATVDDGWTLSAVRRFEDPHVAAVAAVVLDATAPARVIAAGSTWSWGGHSAASAHGCPVEAVGVIGRTWVGPHLAGAFYRRGAFVELGSLDATLPAELAAVDLALRMRHAGRHCVLDCESKIFVDPRLVGGDGFFRRSRHSERLFWRHARQRGWVRSLFAHGCRVAVEALTSIPRPWLVTQLVGRMAGLCDGTAPQISPIAPVAETNAATAVSNPARRVDAAHKSPEERKKASRRSTGRHKRRQRKEII